MVRYTDSKGNVRYLDRYPIYDPRGAVFRIAHDRAVELREMGKDIGQRIVWLALSHFTKADAHDPTPHMDDAKADALLQEIIREAEKDGGSHEQISFR